MSQKFILQAGHVGRNAIARNAVAFIQALPMGKSWAIEIKEHRKPRTLSQNAALWACAYPSLMEYMGERGDKAKERLHEYFCGEYWGWMQPKLGQSRPVRTTTTDMHGNKDVIDTATMSDFYEFVQERGAGVGVMVPDPDPMYGLRGRWAA